MVDSKISSVTIILYYYHYYFVQYLVILIGVTNQFYILS